VPNVRDDRETPLCAGRDGGASRVDLGQAKRNIFLQAGLDSQTRSICPPGNAHAVVQRKADCLESRSTAGVASSADPVRDVQARPP
jgi:hypothetical protein